MFFFLQAKLDLERQASKYASEKERLKDQIAATKVIEMNNLGFHVNIFNKSRSNWASDLTAYPHSSIEPAVMSSEQNRKCECLAGPTGTAT